MNIADVRKQIHARFGEDEGLDEEDQWVERGPAWWSRSYSLEVPPVAPGVEYRYRKADGRIWAVLVDRAYGRYSGKSGEIDLAANIAEIERALGPAHATYVTAPVLSQHVWIKGDMTYVVEAYREDYDDLALSGRAGDVTSVLAYSKSLGPEGFVGYEAAPAPAGVVAAFFREFPEGHVDSGARPTSDELRTLRRYLSSALHDRVRGAVEYRERWIREHPDQPAKDGLPPVILKPPFADGFDFIGSPDGARRHEVGQTRAQSNGTWHVQVRFWYDTTVSWENTVVVTTEQGRYVIDDVLFEAEPNERKGRLSESLRQRWK